MNSTTEKTRAQAAQELYNIQKCYEVKPLKLATVYKKIYKRFGAWHLIGKAHDYTA